jgi:uncharacterized membrane protein
MPLEFTDLIKIAGITFLVVIIWTITIAGAYWDTHQRNISGRARALWLAAVIILPGLGFLIYLLIRLFSAILEPRKRNQRETLTRPVAAKGVSLPTILAADIALEGVAGTQAVQTRQPAAQAACMIKVVSGPEEGKEFLIRTLPARIGRGVETMVRLDGDLGVSRLHAELYQKGSTVWIRDLDSTHGLKVNGTRTDSCQLTPNDRIEVGLSTIVFIETED